MKLGFLILGWIFNESHVINFRFQEEPEMAKFTLSKSSYMSKFTDKFIGKPWPELSSKGVEKDARGKTFREKELSRVFSEDYEAVERMILDPRGPIINRWNKIFLVACLISLFVDPLVFFLPGAKKDVCIEVSVPLEIAITVIRSLADAFYFVQIFIRFRTAYVAPSSRVFGRGELVIDPSRISSRYLRKDFWLDIVAAQPLPQVYMQLAFGAPFCAALVSNFQICF